MLDTIVTAIVVFGLTFIVVTAIILMSRGGNVVGFTNLPLVF